MKRIKSTSLVEVVISALILSIVFAGLVAGFVSVRKYIARTQKRLSGVNVSRNQIDDLYTAVNGFTWDTGVLSPGTATTSVTTDGITYSRKVTVSDIAGANYRAVTVDIGYPGD